MLDNIPAELLLNVLSYLDDLEPLSCASRSLCLSTRDYRTSTLRCRLAAIRNVELLMRIWTPPTFFRRKIGGPLRGYIQRPQDLHDILCDPDMFSRVEAYLGSLERRAFVAEKLAEYVISIVPFNSIRTSEERHSYATTVVIELWSAEARYGHDVDGRWSSVADEDGLEEVHIQDSYVRSLPNHIQTAMVTVYNALAQRLRPPFYPIIRRGHGGGAVEGEGVWLYRLIVKVSLLKTEIGIINRKVPEAHL
ncbi:hypothetical protein Q9L58_003450 [Maublancomyces gigas]|uniref:F-box domain-containing protein n=1 Tax=Discina gigas TaxID=1032678 RepID=A0ABR3GNQ2_9PEZI